jgi:hypothetical protein
MVPQHLIPHILCEAHGQFLAGHFGISKTKERLLQSYYWPNMEKDISEHLQRCNKCQITKKNVASPELLLPLPQCTEPNQRVHADLFGPLKNVDGDKKFILCITDAFTKYVELVVLPNKEALTVATAILNHWDLSSWPAARIYHGPRQRIYQQNGTASLRRVECSPFYHCQLPSSVQ